MGRRHARKFRTNQIEVGRVMQLLKIDVDQSNDVPDTLANAELPKEQEKPLSFWKQFWKEKNQPEPNIRDYIDKIERNQFLGFATREREEEEWEENEEEKGEAMEEMEEECTLPFLGITQEERMKRQRQRMAWKAKWEEISPPIVRKTKKVGKREKAGKTKKAAKKEKAVEEDDDDESETAYVRKLIAVVEEKLSISGVRASSLEKYQTIMFLMALIEDLVSMECPTNY